MASKNVRVRDVMTREVATLERNDKLATADSVMRLGRIRHMPVLDEDGRLAGLVSQRDLFRGALLRALGYGTAAEKKMLDLLVVKEVMVTYYEAVREIARVSAEVIAEAAG